MRKTLVVAALAAALAAPVVAAPSASAAPQTAPAVATAKSPRDQSPTHRVGKKTWVGTHASSRIGISGWRSCGELRKHYAQQWRKGGRFQVPEMGSKHPKVYRVKSIKMTQCYPVKMRPMYQGHNGLGWAYNFRVRVR